MTEVEVDGDVLFVKLGLRFGVVCINKVHIEMELKYCFC